MNETINNRRKKDHPIRRILIIVCAVIFGLFLLLVLRYIFIIEKDGLFRAHNSAAKSDLRNAVTAQGLYHIDNHRYADSSDKLLGKTYGLYFLDDVVVKVISASKDNYSMLAFHKEGDRIYVITWSDREIEVYKKSGDKITL